METNGCDYEAEIIYTYQQVHHDVWYLLSGLY